MRNVRVSDRSDILRRNGADTATRGRRPNWRSNSPTAEARSRHAKILMRLDFSTSRSYGRNDTEWRLTRQ